MHDRNQGCVAMVIVMIVVGFMGYCFFDYILAKQVSYVGNVVERLHSSETDATVSTTKGVGFVHEPEKWQVIVETGEGVFTAKIAPELWTKVKPGTQVAGIYFRGYLSGDRYKCAILVYDRDKHEAEQEVRPEAMHEVRP